MIIKFKKNSSQEGNNIYIQDTDKTLMIFYGKVGDLFMDISGTYVVNQEGKRQTTFSIEQSDEIYPIFETLFDDITNAKVFEASQSDLQKCQTPKERKNLLISCEVQNAELKNSPAHKRLVQGSKIVWKSDETKDEFSNSLEIEKNKDAINLNFVKNPEDQTFGYSIRICNSGSKSRPFNLCFMKMYNSLKSMEKTNTKEEAKTPAVPTK